MIKNVEKYFKTLVISNAIISVLITVNFFIKNTYSFKNISIGLIVLVAYALIWFYSLYKIYNYSRFGLNLYISLSILGFIFNILSNLSYLDKKLYLFTLAEHMIIGSIITFCYFSKIKSKFK